MSHSGSSFRHPPSGKHADRLRQRLRLGAMASARSAITHTEVTENVVDVGEDVIPNLFEQLLARLEQHGLRRCFAEEGEGDTGDDDDNNGARDSGRVDRAHSAETIPVEHDPNSNISATRASVDSSHRREASKAQDGDRDGENNRVPYYYMCVPCELRLTPVSTTAATLHMLQDAHYHFSSADHRSTASWMGDPDIDITLQSSPIVDPSGYTRICVNGIPLLLSTRPGGGDMFYPLPHESYEGGRAIGRDCVFAVERGKVLWNRPLQTLHGGMRQLLFRAPPRRRARRERSILRSQGRHAFTVCRVPVQEYTEDTFVGGGGVPALFALRPRAAPLAVWGDGEAAEPCERVAVRCDGAYRVAVLSRDAAAKAKADAAAKAKAAEDGEGRVWLTSALLREAGAARSLGSVPGSGGSVSGDERLSSSVAPSGWSE